MLESCTKGEGFVDYFVSEDRKNIWIEMNVPSECRSQSVQEKEFYKYKAVR